MIARGLECATHWRLMDASGAWLKNSSFNAALLQLRQDSHVENRKLLPPEASLLIINMVPFTSFNALDTSCTQLLWSLLLHFLSSGQSLTRRVCDRLTKEAPMQGTTFFRRHFPVRVMTAIMQGKHLRKSKRGSVNAIKAVLSERQRRTKRSPGGSSLPALSWNVLGLHQIVRGIEHST